MARTALIALMIVACAMGAHARVLLADECAGLAAPTISGGTFNTCTLTSSGDECSGSCDAGYTGSFKATCDTSGASPVWTVTGSCDLIQCSSAPTVANGAFADCALPKGDTNTCQATCDNGFSGSVTATCGASGWTVAGSCTPVCTGSPAIDNFVFSCGATTAPGGTCTAQCAAGYRPGGDLDLTAECDNDGAWVNPTGTCELIECTGNPTAVTNGDFACQPTTPGGNCTATCQQGYKGDVTATCAADGTWETPVGTCERIVCAGSPDTDGTTFTCPNTPSGSGDVCSGTCSLGYNNSPGTPTATCGLDGEWHVENACIKNRCSGSPTTTTGSVFTCGASSPIDNVCTGKCSGKCKGQPPKARCLIDGTWGPVEGDCSGCTPSGRG